MLTEALFDAFIAMIHFFIDSIVAVAGLSGVPTVEVPRPFLDVVTHIFSKVMENWPVMFAFFVWRQVKS